MFLHFTSTGVGHEPWRVDDPSGDSGETYSHDEPGEEEDEIGEEEDEESQMGEDNDDRDEGSKEKEDDDNEDEHMKDPSLTDSDGNEGGNFQSNTPIRTHFWCHLSDGMHAPNRTEFCDIKCMGF
ncbi:hypothetical protein DFH29DRAFT_1005746 [Suillus ampliporus]|nr:hypothetical protein DFH29DRAFT_1005746 [Suillus ampliporus]